MSSMVIPENVMVKLYTQNYWCGDAISLVGPSQHKFSQEK